MRSRTREVHLDYAPRPWQDRVHRERRRFCVVVAHRRSGKTALALAELADAALRTPSSQCVYLAPTRTQAKTVAWSRLKDFVRPVPGVQVFEVELRITFPNNSSISLAGALDGADALRGSGYDAVVLDEYSLMGEAVFASVIRPALTDRGGWAIFVGTPLGRDALFHLIQQTRGLADWSHFTFPASATGVLSEDELRAARSTMPEDAYAREFECDFSAAPPGSIFGAVLAALRAAGRILPSVEWVEGVDAWASLDLGIADATSAWVGQSIGAEHRVLLYREWTGVGLADTGRTLRDLGVTTIFAPHDVKVRELVSGRSRLDALESLGFRVEVAPRCDVEEGISAASQLLASCVFDEEYAAEGLDHLAMYRRDIDDRRGGRGPPIHDGHSHAADAFRYLALCLSDRAPPAFRDPATGRVWTAPRVIRVTGASGEVRTVQLREEP